MINFHTRRRISRLPACPSERREQGGRNINKKGGKKRKGDEEERKGRKVKKGRGERKSEVEIMKGEGGKMDIKEGRVRGEEWGKKAGDGKREGGTAGRRVEVMEVERELGKERGGRRTWYVKETRRKKL